MKGILIMEKITIKNFIDEYNKRGTTTMKDEYIRDYIEITKYVPFTQKLVRAKNLMKATMIDSEGNFVANSAFNYLFFVKTFIEEYTNLISESASFADEYDMLKSSGFLDKLMLSTETTRSLIDPSELSEFKSLCDMVVKDQYDNEYEIHSFIKNQITRIEKLGTVALDSISDAIKESIGNLDEETLNKLKESFEGLGNKSAFKEV